MLTNKLSRMISPELTAFFFTFSLRVKAAGIKEIQSPVMLEHLCAWAEPMFVLIAEKCRLLQKKKKEEKS